MALTVHRRDVQETRLPEKAQARLRQEAEFAALLKSISEPKPASKNERIRSAVSQASQAHNVDPHLVYAVIKQESGFQECARSHCGAEGLMQLMPETARNLGVTNSYDIEQNIDGGVRYLRQMLDQFGGNPKLALAAYNAGPGAVQKYGGIPPYDETQNYVKSIMAHYQALSGGAPLPDFMDTDLSLLAKSLEQRIVAQAAISQVIASTPLNLPMPERRRNDDEPPPPPPPTAVRV